MELYLIRHFQTQGNLKRRYIGATDEPLAGGEHQKEAAARLQEILPVCPVLAASPMRRCVETAKLLYPGRDILLCSGLRECSFGVFENKTNEELADNVFYQRWLASGGNLPFPGGESRQEFSRRCVRAFEELVGQWMQQKIPCAVLVVHGGTIMAVMEKYALLRQDFYCWQAENGGGFKIRLEDSFTETHMQEEKEGRRRFICRETVKL